MRGTDVFLSVVLTGLVGYGVYCTQQESCDGDVVTRSVPLSVTIATPEAEQPEDKTEGQALEIDASLKKCFVLGPVSQSLTKRIADRLRRSGLEKEMVICDRFLPERFIVFLGPLENKTALRAFAKQLKQQGYKNVRPIERGALAPGLEIAEFETEYQAAAYIESGKAPGVSGIRVIKRLGEPSGQVNVVFQALDESEAKKVFSLAGKFAGLKVQECPKD